MIKISMYGIYGNLAQIHNINLISNEMTFKSYPNGDGDRSPHFTCVVLPKFHSLITNLEFMEILPKFITSN